MSFWQKMKNAARSFMIGRNGSDEMTVTILLASLILMLVTSLFGVPVLGFISDAGYIYCLFRMFSKNVVKRRAENARFVSAKSNAARSVSQFMVRMKSMRKYKYFKCPECHSRLRLPRKVGQVTVKCGKCGHKFEQRA